MSKRRDPDMDIPMPREFFEKGAPGSKDGCPIALGGSSVTGTEVEVGIVMTDDGELVPRMYWNMPEMGQIRRHQADLTPAGKARKIIMSNDVAGRRALLREFSGGTRLRAVRHLSWARTSGKSPTSPKSQPKGEGTPAPRGKCNTRKRARLQRVFLA